MSKGFVTYDDANQMLARKRKGGSEIGASLAC
jgi:hypothetical protein